MAWQGGGEGGKGRGPGEWGQGGGEEGEGGSGGRRRCRWKRGRARKHGAEIEEEVERTGESEGK